MIVLYVLATAGIIGLGVLVVDAALWGIRAMAERRARKAANRDTQEHQRLRAIIADELCRSRPTDDDIVNSGAFYARLMADMTTLERATDDRLNDMDGLLGNVVVALKQMRQEIRAMSRRNRRGRPSRLVELSESMTEEMEEETS